MWCIQEICEQSKRCAGVTVCRTDMVSGLLFFLKLRYICAVQRNDLSRAEQQTSLSSQYFSCLLFHTASKRSFELTKTSRAGQAPDSSSSNFFFETEVCEDSKRFNLVRAAEPYSHWRLSFSRYR